MRGDTPIAYMWQEENKNPDTQDGPGDWDTEICFDTAPPIEGTEYTELYEAAKKVLRYWDWNDLAVMRIEMENLRHALTQTEECVMSPTTIEFLQQFKTDNTKEWPKWMQDTSYVASANFPK